MANDVERLLSQVYQERFADDLDPPPRNLDAYRDLGYASMLAGDLMESPLTVEAILDLALDDLADVWALNLESAVTVPPAVKSLASEWARAAGTLEAGSRDALTLRTAAAILKSMAKDLQPELVIESLQARQARDQLFDMTARFYNTEAPLERKRLLTDYGPTPMVLHMEAHEAEPLLEQLLASIE